MNKQLNALNNFIYKDKEGKTNNHFKKLPLKSKRLFLKIFNKHLKKESKWLELYILLYALE